MGSTSRVEKVPEGEVAGARDRRRDVPAPGSKEALADGVMEGWLTSGGRFQEISSPGRKRRRRKTKKVEASKARHVVGQRNEVKG